MSVSYKKLWKLLIDMDLNNTDLRNAIGISSFTIARMTLREDVGTGILKRLCSVMKCDIGDIVEFKPDIETVAGIDFDAAAIQTFNQNKLGHGLVADLEEITSDEIREKRKAA